MVARSLETLEHGGDRRNQDANLHLDRQQVADLLHVSTRSVATAAKIEREAPAPVADAVRAGAMSLNLAS